MGKTNDKKPSAKGTPDLKSSPSGNKLQNISPESGKKTDPVVDSPANEAVNTPPPWRNTVSQRQKESTQEEPPSLAIIASEVNLLKRRFDVLDSTQRTLRSELNKLIELTAKIRKASEKRDASLDSMLAEQAAQIDHLYEKLEAVDNASSQQPIASGPAPERAVSHANSNRQVDDAVNRKYSDDRHRAIYYEGLPNGPKSISRFICTESEIKSILTLSQSATVPSANQQVLTRLEEAQKAKFLAASTPEALTPLKLSRSNPTGWFYWHSQFELASRQRGWIRRGILTHIPIAYEGNPGEFTPEADEKYADVISCAITYDHVKGYCDFLTEQAKMTNAVWTNWLLSQRQWMAHAIFDCIDESLQQEIINATQSELRTDGPCLLRWLRDSILIQDERLFMNLHEEFCNRATALRENPTAEQVYDFLTERQKIHRRLSHYFIVTEQNQAIYLHFVQDNLLLVRNPYFVNHMKKFMDKLNEPLTLKALIPAALAAYSQHLVTPASSDVKSSAKSADHEPRSLLAAQTATLSSEASLHDDVKQLVALLVNQQATAPGPSPYKRPGQEGNYPHKRSKTDTHGHTKPGRGPDPQRGGRGGRGGRGLENGGGTFSWKRKPPFNKPPTDMSKLHAYTGNPDMGYKYFCCVCQRWGSHATAECIHLDGRDADTCVVSYFNPPGKTTGLKQTDKRTRFAGLGQITGRQAIVSNERSSTPIPDELDDFEPAPRDDATRGHIYGDSEPMVDYEGESE
jgi:hypothetical protein